MSRPRLWALRLSVAVAAPLLVLGVVEGLLRLAGTGYTTDFFIEAREGTLTGNPRFGWRFFPRPLSREPALIRLAAEKQPDSYRVFVLGGSAARGTPRPAFGLARMLEAMLGERFPATEFEVVNAAMTAINSHVVLPIAREAAELEPDLFVVYLGNNEVVGPYGPGTVFAGFSPSLATIRAGLWLKTTRTGQAIEGLLSPLSAPGDAWGGMGMFLGQELTADDPRLGGVYRHLADNLDDVAGAAVDAGAQVVVSTVVTNLADCPPFASPEAERHYRSGRELLEVGRIDEAEEQLVAARDLDTLRFRADSGINETIRRIAGGRESDGVHLVDAERLLARADGGLPPGAGLLHEHVHLTFRGNYELARLLFERIVALLPESIRGSGTTAAPSIERCAARLALTAGDRLAIANEIASMVRRPPFTGQLDDRLQEQVARSLPGLRGAARADDPLPVYRRAIAASPDDPILMERLATLLAARRSFAEAAAEWRRLLAELPGWTPARIGLGCALAGDGEIEAARRELDAALRAAANPTERYELIGRGLEQAGRRDEAIRYLEAGLDGAPGSARLLNALGQLKARAGEATEAIALFEAALAARPDVAELHYNLGTAAYAAEDWTRALEQFRKAVELAPRFGLAHGNLAKTLSRSGDDTAALPHYARALELRPSSAAIRTLYAAALRRLGRDDEAGAIER